MTTQWVCQAFCTTDDAFGTDEGCQLDRAQNLQLLAATVDQASDILFQLSGGRVFGVCTRTVRPVSDGHCGPMSPLDWAVFPVSSSPFSWSWRTSGYESDRFGGLRTVPLAGPNTTVTQVKVDGAVLATSAYDLLDGNNLARIDGSSWPTANDLTLADTAVGTWSITFTFGYVIDFITKAAAAELAADLALAYLGRANRMPAGVRGINVQGAIVDLGEVADGLRAGNEELPAVSRFLGVYGNPNDGSRRTTAVWSPELDQGWNLVTRS